MLSLTGRGVVTTAQHISGTAEAICNTAATPVSMYACYHIARRANNTSQMKAADTNCLLIERNQIHVGKNM